MTHSLPGQPSLRRRLLRRLMLPIALVWFAATGLTTFVANHFAQRAFDRSLIDDAYSLAAHVQLVDGKVTVNLSPREVSNLLFDQTEAVFFAVADAHGHLLAGDTGLERAITPEEAQPVFIDIVHQGRPLRAVVLHVQQPVRLAILVGQTTRSRSELLHKLLIYSLLPQAFLLGLLAWWLRHGIDRELEPLDRLRIAIEVRDASDLSPLPSSVNQGRSTLDIVRLSQSLDGLLHKVKEGIDAQKEFAGNVAHELRTPLAGIRALADYGLRQSDPAVWKQQLQAITQSQERASHIVDQLLALAFATEAGQALQLEPIALDELVREVLLAAIPKADAQGADLGAEGLENTCKVMAHRGLLEGLLVNLIDNALRYGSVAPAKPVITVSIEPPPDHASPSNASDSPPRVWLLVCDEGPGLAPEKLHHFKQRWSQGVQAQYMGQGHGLGLDIVRRYAHLLQADLVFALGKDGRGLCVRVGLKPAVD